MQMPALHAVLLPALTAETVSSTPTMPHLHVALLALLHPYSIPITGLFVAVPSLLAAAGQPAEMTAAVRAYLLALLPNLWLDAMAR